MVAAEKEKSPRWAQAFIWKCRVVFCFGSVYKL